MRIIEELVTHEIFADNLLMGKSALFTLKLAPEWQLAPGVSRPEVVASHERRNRKWVASGDAWYVVYDGERRWALELHARIRPVPRNPQPLSDGSTNVGGHPADLTWKEKRRGLPWNRHTVTYMTVRFDCPHTDRQLRLEFSGWCPQEGFQEIIRTLQHLRCH